MKYSKLIRRILALSLTAVVLSLALMTASYPIYLEVVKALTIPYAIVLGAYFGTDMVKNYKNRDTK